MKNVTKILHETPTLAKKWKGILPPKRVELYESLLGTRISVWWPAEKRFYGGEVLIFDYRDCTHNVMYDDGDARWHSLSEFYWRREQEELSKWEARWYNPVFKRSKNLGGGTWDTTTLSTTTTTVVDTVDETDDNTDGETVGGTGCDIDQPIVSSGCFDGWMLPSGAKRRVRHPEAQKIYNERRREKRRAARTLVLGHPPAIGGTKLQRLERLRLAAQSAPPTGNHRVQPLDAHRLAAKSAPTEPKRRGRPRLHPREGKGSRERVTLIEPKTSLFVDLPKRTYTRPTKDDANPTKRAYTKPRKDDVNPYLREYLPRNADRDGLPYKVARSYRTRTVLEQMAKERVESGIAPEDSQQTIVAQHKSNRKRKSSRKSGSQQNYTSSRWPIRMSSDKLTSDVDMGNEESECEFVMETCDEIDGIIFEQSSQPPRLPPFLKH